MAERDRLKKLLNEAFIKSDDNFGMPSIKQVTDYLVANGVIVLPCKVGDVVYTNINGTSLQNSFRVESVDLLGFSNGLYSWTWHQLGKSVFLTLEETEQALIKEDEKNG